MLTGSHIPTIGETFVIVSNDGNDPIIGTFNTLPEGDTIPNFLGSGFDAMITYVGGDGNDVELTVLSDCTGIQVIYVDASAGGNNNGSSWIHAFTDLQDALIAGAVCPDLDSIFVAQGTYYPTPTNNRDTSFWIPDGVVVLGGFPAGGSDLFIRDWVAFETILSGDIGLTNDISDNSYHVVRTLNVDSSTIVDGFNITGGYADGVFPNNVGGGWYNDGSGSGNSSNPTIRHCRFVDNSSVAGGAMYNNGEEGGDSSPVLTHCVLSGNVAFNRGGAMFNLGYNGGESSPVLINCVLSGNFVGDHGGAMYNSGLEGESFPVLTNCVLSGNYAFNNGGAMYNFGSGGESSPIITNSIFYNNDASNLGPVLYNADASPSISYSMFGVDFNAINNPGGTMNMGNNKFSTDPLFLGPILASAAPTTAGDFHLLATSPAIDMGINDSITVTTDLDGLPRIQNGIVDMGAFESQGSIDCQVLNGIAYVDTSAGGNNDGSSWMHAFTDLQDALIAGASCPDIDTILVAQGTYYPTPTGNRDTSFWIPDSVVLLGGFPGGGGELGERNRECHETILSGDIGMPGDSTDNSYHVIRTINVDSTTILDGFTITGGYADGSYPNNVGGGWYNDGSGVGNSSNPTIHHCRFVDNYGVAGGAMYNYGFDGGESSPVLKNCVLSGNTASREGGAMYNNGLEGESSPVLTNCDLLGNYAFYNGGAMYNGGIVGGESSPVLINCVLSGNTANGDGGAMYNGGVVGGESSPALINCVLSGNTANGDGGAMYNGGVEGESSPIITNSIFYNNHASNLGPVLFNLIASPSISYSMFGVDFNVVNEGGGTLDNGNNKFSTDPLFVLPIEAGQAPTTAGDFHLLATSPAIDMGDNSANSEIYDLDGLSRIYNGTIDIGAYEWRPYCLPDTVYLDENGDAMVVEEELIGELPEFTGCMIDTVVAVPEISCSDTVVLYNLLLIRDGQDTVFRCGDTIWVLDTIAPVIDMVEVELMLGNNCMATMPDLSPFASDNCAIDTVLQSPEVGEPLGFPGTIVMVTLIAIDSSGNETDEMIEIEVQESAPVLPLNCRAQISPAIHPDGTITITVNDLITNASCLANHDVAVYNQWGGVIWQATDLRSSDYVLADVNLCSFLGEVLEFSVGNELGSCNGTLLLEENSGVELISAFGTTIDEASDIGIPTARIDTGLLVTYCGYVPDASLHQPEVIVPCRVINTRSSVKPYSVQVQPDWVEIVPCNVASDTAKIIYRTWEAYDKEGNLSTLTDTIVVIRLPKLTPGAFVAEAEDTAYCELETVTHKDEALKRYASWKQPVGLHDYELTYTKLRGVTYEIPASIILAGLANAFTQGGDVYEEYLKCVILRKANGVDSVTIGDIVSGDYINELLASATTEQKRYGFLQALIELNEDPLVFLLGAGSEFYPYLLLEEGDWVLSEGGNFEKVTDEWFYNGNNNNPYWFAGGWPSIYGSGDCVSYCDVGGGEEFGCIQVLVPSLSLDDEMEGGGCDTICLQDGMHCGITISQDPLTVWSESCPQTRSMDTWITQTCWGVTPNYCADDAIGDAGPVPCEFLSAEDNPDDAVVDYSCSDKAVKIHLSQWQTLLDAIGPIFDFCYPYRTLIGVAVVERPTGPGGDNENPGPVEFALSAPNFAISDGECFSGEEFWDHTAIQDAIRNGVQYDLANKWERCNPTIYRVGSHECVAEVFVPDVQVIDNCSGVHSVKAMVEVQGGTRAVALEQTSVEHRISRDGDTCFVYTYSHTTNPITVPPESFRGSGCDGDPIEVRYEAADNCWNQSEWFKYIRIVDDTPPTVIADDEVNVSLNSKTAWIPAETFDEGSWDNCALDLKLARRSDWVNYIDICPDTAALPEGGYNGWVDILDALGIDRADAATAVGGGIVGAAGVNTRYNVDELSIFFSDDEVEEYFLHQIIWMWEDGQACGQQVVHAWLFALASYIAENCSTEDDHDNGLDVRELEVVFDNLFDRPGYGNEVALMGGGWAQAVPFKCEDACLPVSAELLVMDACCNWAVGWSDVTVEDKSNVRVVRELPDLAISCEAYNIFYKDIVEAAAALGENGSDTTGIFAALDSALGGYIPTWVNNQGLPTDIDGHLIPDSLLTFDYYNVTCAEKSEYDTLAVENHDGSTGWETVVSKTTYLDTAITSADHGIIGINCAATYVQDVWVDLDDCGQGTITRRFFITSGCGDYGEAREVQQVITIGSACGMRESMFDLPVSLGTKANPICLPQGLSDNYLVDTIGRMTLKPHLSDQLCNSLAIGHEIRELNVLGSDNMKKYEITWTAIDWCADQTSSNRQISYTQEVIAVIDPACVVGGENDTAATDTTTTPIGSDVVLKDRSEMVLKEEQEKAILIEGAVISASKGLKPLVELQPIVSSSKGLQTNVPSSKGLKPLEVPLVLYQNRPNPFNGETIIGFRLPKASQATLSIYDVTGRLIKSVEGDYAAGYNEVRLRAQDLGITGVLYYQLDTEDYVTTKRMVIVN